MSEMSVVLQRVALRNDAGDHIQCDIRYVHGSGQMPVVIICHSFMAFKDWGFFPYIAEKIAGAGFVSLIFNFSHNGVVGNGNRITDFVQFSRNTFSQELRDLRSVINAVDEGRSIGKIADRNRIGLLGHSRGGGIAIVHASADKRIKALASWSAIASFDRWTKHQKDAWRSNGFLPMAKNSSISPLRLGLELLEDIETGGSELNITSAANSINCPWLILHGHEDVTVPVREAEQLYAAANKRIVEKKIFDHAGHLYNAASRNEDDYTTLDNVVGFTIDWFRQKLS